MSPFSVAVAQGIAGIPSYQVQLSDWLCGLLLLHCRWLYDDLRRKNP